MKPIYFALLIIVIINLFLLPTFLLKVPPVWPDESVYAEVANNILKENRLGSDFWGNLIPGVKDCACWYPPAYFYLTAFWFKIFGLSIENQRMFSVVAGAFFLLIFYFLCRVFFKKSWFWGLALVGVLADITFLRAARLSRPEVVILLLSAASIYFYLQGSGEKKRIWPLLLSGFFASMAFLTHTIGIFVALSIGTHMLLTQGLRLAKNKTFYLFLLSFVMPILVWLVMIFPKINFVYQQMALSLAVKMNVFQWLVMILGNEPFEVKLIYFGYFVISTAYFIFCSKRRQYLLLGLVLLFAWIAVFYGQMMWYFALPVPFVYLAGMVLVAEIPKQRIWLVLFLLLIAANLYHNFNTFVSLKGDRYSYHAVEQKILKLVPPGRSVILSSTPDYYYGFKARGEKEIYKTPILTKADKRQEYFQLLNRADYLVYTPYRNLIFGDFLERYIVKNNLEIFKISEPFLDEVYVIQFKPAGERVDHGI